MDDQELANCENNVEDDVYSIINHIETRDYLKSSNISIKELVQKISEFSSFLNGEGRLALLHADTKESQELLPLMLILKKNIKSALSEIGQSNNKKIHNYTCPKCEEIIEIPPYVDNWTYIQNHQHFEELLVNFLEGSMTLLDVPAVDIEATPSTNENFGEDDSLDHEQTDSGIDYEEGFNENLSPDEEEPLGSNTFRFNFKPSYDSAVESVLYPDSFKSLTKFDSCQYLCIQKVNSYRAVCLLCGCDLVSKFASKKLSVKHCIDHVLGQRHTKSCEDVVSLAALENYHELFWNLDPPYQAHQVYFIPKSPSTVLCRLCNAIVQNKNLIEHVQGKIHKGYILDLFNNKSFSEFFLLDHHLNMYGIKIDNVVPQASANKSPKKEPKEERKKNRSRANTPAEIEVEHIIERAFPYPLTNTSEDFVANRYKEHLKFFKDKETHFVCAACSCNINKTREDIKRHILSAQHQQFSKIKTPKYKYFCEPCFQFLKDEADWDKHFSRKDNRHSKLPKPRMEKAAEFECTGCKVVLYGDDISIIRHKNQGGAKKDKPSVPRLTEEIKTLFKSIEAIENECERLIDEDNELSLKKTLDCTKRIQEVLSTVFKECEAFPFGSRVSGLGNDKSDLDLFIDTGNMYYGKKNQDALSQGHIVKQVESILSKHRTEFSRIVAVAAARTPIVKVHHLYTGIDCDLSFRHGLSVENTEFIKLCLQIQPIALPLILILKKWSQFTQMSEHITTYALSMMVIFYLQLNGFLLSVSRLFALNPAPAPVINGWKTIKYTASVESLKGQVTCYRGSVVPLIKGFFKYYSSFVYEEDCICPLLGHTIKRKLFQDALKLPPEMESYVKQLRTKNPEGFRYLSPFCIQDPFDLSHNLTKACQSINLDAFKKYCALTYDHLCLLE